MKIPLQCASLILATVFSLVCFQPTEALAQSTKQAVPPKDELDQNLSGIDPVSVGPWTLQFQYRVLVDFSRAYELETIGGQNYYWRNDFRFGIVHKSGWGLMGTYAINDQSYADPLKNSHANEDASIILEHPTWYKSKDVEINGFFRQYLPTSDSSKDRHIYESAYYMLTDVTLARRWVMSNVLIPRYFYTPAYNVGDIDYYAEDDLTFNYHLNRYIGFAIGAYTQWEHHSITDPGTAVEYFPQISFTPVKNIFCDVRVYLPLYVDGTVSSEPGPTNVSLDQTYVELFFKASI